MRRFTISFATTFLVAALVIVALVGVRYSPQHEPSSHLLAASNVPSPAPNPTSTLNLDTSADVGSSATTCPTVDYGYDMTADGPDLEPYANPDSTPGVPLYPGAELRSENCDRRCVSSCLSYYIAGGEDQSKVQAFYNEALPKRGWESIHKSDADGRFFYQNYYKNNSTYTWKNPSHSGPGRAFLTVGFTQEAGGTAISVHISAWPDPKNPPVHLQAKEVETKWTKDAQYGFPVRIVSYTVNVSESEVVDYYKKVMKQQGWCLNLKDSSDSKLVYFFELNGPGGISDATVSTMPIETSSESARSSGNNYGSVNAGDNHSTRVLITTSSDDFTPEDAHEGK